MKDKSEISEGDLLEMNLKFNEESHLSYGIYDALYLWSAHLVINVDFGC